jgi:hypothetical protein
VRDVWAECRHALHFHKSACVDYGKGVLLVLLLSTR